MYLYMKRSQKRFNRGPAASPLQASASSARADVVHSMEYKGVLCTAGRQSLTRHTTRSFAQVEHRNWMSKPVRPHVINGFIVGGEPYQPERANIVWI